jgi:uncharacterized membrane protein YeaQ/YmgE (transglycosylase-associated protein family)
MTLFVWLVLGAGAGYFGSKLFKPAGPGWAVDIVLGAIGAVVCGYIGAMMGISGVSGVNLASLLSVIVAVVGALAVLTVYRSVAARA